MTEATVPADVWACKQPGEPFVAAIVEEENYWTGVPGLDPDDDVPPAWLVALRDARCERCKGDGYHNSDNEWSCPDCLYGRLLHDVRVGYDHEDYGLGTVTVRCLVDVVPVVSYESYRNDMGLSGPLIYIDGDHVMLYVHSGEIVELTPAHVEALAAACGKPPAEWPGGYAVILTEVTDARDQRPDAHVQDQDDRV